MRYTVSNRDTEYCVMEKPSGLSVYYTGTQELAVRMAQLLNEGSGFDGNTPTFFAEPEQRDFTALTLVR